MSVVKEKVSVEALFSAADAVVALIQYNCLSPDSVVFPSDEASEGANDNNAEKASSCRSKAPKSGRDGPTPTMYEGKFHTGKYGMNSLLYGEDCDIQAWMLEVLCDLEDTPAKELTRGNC